MEFENETNQGPSAHLDTSAASSTEKILLKYYPDDNETSFWMYAMISVGTAFVLFVAVTIYLMCHSTIRQVAEHDRDFPTTTTTISGRKVLRHYRYTNP